MINHRIKDRAFDLGLHLAAAAIALVAAFHLRFDFPLPAAAVPLLQHALVITMLAKIPVFIYAGLDNNLRRFAGISDLPRLVWANLLGSVFFTAIALLWIGRPFPRSVYLLDLILCFLFTCLIWFSERVLSEMTAHRLSPQKLKEIVIYGAGTAGAILLREIRTNPRLGYKAIGFLDDDLRKSGAQVMGIPVLGTGREGPGIQDRLSKRNRWIDEVIIAIPSANGRQMQEALANCRAAHLPCKTIPSLGELLSGSVLSSQIRDLNLADLLERQPVQIDELPISSSIAGRSVMVTGGAGSIGSELCRQIARFRPSRLVALDQAESELFKLECELSEKFPDLELIAALGDIRDRERLRGVIQDYGIQSVFHAAAYKHVPMLESHAIEAARNNILGTWNLLNVVRESGVTNFLMISTDKAVNPTSVMGATKRVCELMVSAVPPHPKHGTPQCVSVRFGNVLGSNGSVVPIFQRQIAAGGPVRVTHPDITRYFMTIPEAVLLVLQASTIGKGREVFVLDMGQPIGIVDLARNLIRLAGLEPYKDIDIQFSGLRPGEKLYEEISLPSEGVLPTCHDKIKIFQEFSPRWSDMQAWMAEFEGHVTSKNESGMITLIKSLVPEYTQAKPSRTKEEERTLEFEFAPGKRPRVERLAQA